MHHQRGRQTQIERQLIEDLQPLTVRNPRLTAADQKARWRADYNEAVACNFAYCIGHRHVGDTFASWETLTPLQWARRNGVPVKLVQTWEAERLSGGTKARSPGKDK